MGCAPIVKDGLTAEPQSYTELTAGHPVGQTIIARDGGLQGVQVWLSPGTAGSGDVVLHLREDPQSSADLTTAILPLEPIIAPRYYRFLFTPQNDSQNKNYFMLLEQSGSASVQVGTLPANVYLDGSAYADGEPRDAQLAFLLEYDSLLLFFALLGQAGRWLAILGAVVFMFVLPGWVLLTDLPVRLDWPERLGLAVGLSLALYPLLMLWTNLGGLYLGIVYAWLPGLVALAVLGWRRRRWRPDRSAWTRWRSSLSWPELALPLVLALVFGVRFWAIRSLEFPMWGDSYQHTVIAQLIADHGGLFNSWQPYAEMQTFTYHFGFHSLATVFHWLTALDMPQAVLWMGQVLNGLAVLVLYPLGTRIGGNRWAGVTAVLIGGLLSPMPMGYVNWGRYTQLAGQAILPAAIWLSWMALDSPKRDWRVMALAWVALGGLATTHYRILIFTTFFFVAALLWNLRRWRVVLARTVLLAMGGGLLFIPWFMHTFAGKILVIFSAQLSTLPSAVQGFAQEYNAVGDWNLYLPGYLWILFVLSLLFALARRNKPALLFASWWFLVLVAANPQWLRLPGEGALTNFAVFIAAYIPAAVLIGGAVGWVSTTRSQRVVPLLLFILVGALGTWGVRQRVGDIHIMQSALATRSDQRAAEWIRRNTPTDAVFLVNEFSAYGGSSVVGSDGGWWLPLLAGRRTSLPPLNYVAEQGPRADYYEWINALPAEIQKKGITDPQVISLLRERGIGYVYVGQRQGEVNAPGPALLQVSQLSASPLFRPVYHHDRTWVFQVVQ